MICEQMAQPSYSALMKVQFIVQTQDENFSQQLLYHITKNHNLFSAFT
jgi:hypothetical protein